MLWGRSGFHLSLAVPAHARKAAGRASPRHVAPFIENWELGLGEQAGNPRKIKRAVTLVTLQPPAPARELNSVDACTVTALDAIAAFAAQTPTAPRRAVGFFGSGYPTSCLARSITQSTSDQLTFYFSQPFQPSTRETLNPELVFVNAQFRCK